MINNKDIIFYYNSFLKIRSRRRAITDIIGTLSLLMVTVVGSVTLTYFMNDAFVNGDLGGAATSTSATQNSKSLELLSYDARDSSNLFEISSLDNINNGILCGVSCAANSNQIPKNDGTEFLILEIKNPNFNPVFVHDVYLNNVEHTWEKETGGNLLDADVFDSSGNSYPRDGKFSIIPSSSLIQFSENIIESGEYARIVIKLGVDDEDISLNDAVLVRINSGSMISTEFLIFGGSTR